VIANDAHRRTTRCSIVRFNTGNPLYETLSDALGGST
jgi:hypothetical protein